ncbi:hypothetical protein HPB48_026993 [Haemaphysalis longicornis]|uniref:Uncharacterized protein n=1 Tax=Haemaphysalis longicornis TaxID=44386 RepID=A0A9J6HDP6_HAELO|nr:hypothetical protein HPB48_026993 [Haemaphysalis longicornis]
MSVASAMPPAGVSAALAAARAAAIRSGLMPVEALSAPPPLTITGALPSYYNPTQVNALKYSEQMQKRKLLWKKPQAEGTGSTPPEAPADKYREMFASKKLRVKRAGSSRNARGTWGRHRLLRLRQIFGISAMASCSASGVSEPSSGSSSANQDRIDTGESAGRAKHAEDVKKRLASQSAIERKFKLLDREPASESSESGTEFVIVDLGVINS